MPPSASASPDWFTLVMGLFGGLALFLYGLNQLSDGLKHAAGEALKTLLTSLTTNRFLGALTGAFASAERSALRGTAQATRCQRCH
jgi:phosphate:Na+ symporter